MSKRYDFHDDMYLLHYSMMGSFHMARDLGRSEASINARVRKLKKTGAWVALDQIERWAAKYREAIGTPTFLDEMDRERGNDPTAGAVHALGGKS